MPVRAVGRGAVAGVAVGLVVVLAAGCGSRSASDTGSDTGSGTGTGTGTQGGTAAARVPSAAPATTRPGPAELLAQHDASFPDVAARCTGVGATALPPPSVPAGVPADPMAQKYAENNAFKQARALQADEKCRGDAHAARLAAALKATGRSGAALGEAGLKAELDRLGYPSQSARTYGSATTVGFSLWIPGPGPCLTGTSTTETVVRAHGPYLEGGCTEPRGGH
ncbi:hypothetical protein ACWGB8_31160 [Kitasatospora sp. NPDC054939]